MELSDTSFGGTKVPWNVPWNSIELSDMSFGGTRVPWNIPWNSIEYLCHLKWCPPDSMESHGTRWFFYLATPEFYGIYLGSPTRVKCHKMAISKFHGTKWYFIRRHQSSMECSMEFHRTKWYVIWRHQSSMEYSMEFHRIFVSFEMVPS